MKFSGTGNGVSDVLELKQGVYKVSYSYWVNSRERLEITFLTSTPGTFSQEEGE
jgi:hypothetical protein